MSQKTKIFGFEIPVNQKVLAGGLFAAVIGIAAYNLLGGGSGDQAPVSDARPSVGNPVSPSVHNPSQSVNVSRPRDSGNRGKQAVLQVKPIDPASVVDPTLKLGLLDKVHSVKLSEGGRSLFETGPDMAAIKKLPSIPVVNKMIPKPFDPVGPRQPPPPPQVHVNIPLRYYGFVRPTLRGDGNRGYFMDGENILMATEGDVLEGHFLVVALSPNTARIEDIQLKQGQDLQLIPEAITQ